MLRDWPADIYERILIIYVMYNTNICKQLLIWFNIYNNNNIREGIRAFLSVPNLPVFSLHFDTVQWALRRLTQALQTRSKSVPNTSQTGFYSKLVHTRQPTFSDFAQILGICTRFSFWHPVTHSKWIFFAHFRIIIMIAFYRICITKWYSHL